MPATLKELGMENKHIVIKREDIEVFLPKLSQELLNTILGELSHNRTRAGKNSNEYLVVNLDESYAENIADIIKENLGNY